MSVIMAYKTKDKIYIGADNRTTALEDGSFRDNVNKIISINNDVAVAFSGSYKSQILFNAITRRKKNKINFRVEDALKYIKKIHRICKLFWFKRFSKQILNVGANFLVVGKNRNDEYCIYAVSISEGKLEEPTPVLKDWFIFPPHEADAIVCFDIYTKNAKKYPNKFIQRTIKDIAKNNKYISSSGDVWIYDIKTGKSSSEHFN